MLRKLLTNTDNFKCGFLYKNFILFYFHQLCRIFNRHLTKKGTYLRLVGGSTKRLENFVRLLLRYILNEPIKCCTVDFISTSVCEM